MPRDVLLMKGAEREREEEMWFLCVVFLCGCRFFFILFYLPVTIGFLLVFGRLIASNAFRSPPPRRSVRSSSSLP